MASGLRPEWHSHSDECLMAEQEGGFGVTGATGVTGKTGETVI